MVHPFLLIQINGFMKKLVAANIEKYLNLNTCNYLYRMIQLIDQLKRNIVLTSIPQRIISLVPSQTELLFDLGLDDEIVGITKFCIHPDSLYRKKTRVGGTKQIDFEKIVQLNPEVIICNKEENDMVQVNELMHRFSVWVSDVRNLDDALEMIQQIGNLVGKEERAYALQQNIRRQFNLFNPYPPFEKSHPLNTAYFIWKNPLMSVGADTFIHDMLSRCGLKNAFMAKTRYPEITMQELSHLSPDVILLSSEPFPFKEKHLADFKRVCPESKILLADGEFFSWYGSRLLKAPDYFRSLVKQIHYSN